MPKSDYQKLASAFIDLWQEQISRSLNDKDTVRQVMQFMQQLQPDGGSREQAYRHASHASEPRDDELADLRQRLAACERRIRQLETHLASLRSAEKQEKSNKKQPAKPARPGSGHAKPAAAGRKPATKSSAAKKAVPKRAVRRGPAKRTK